MYGEIVNTFLARSKESKLSKEIYLMTGYRLHFSPNSTLYHYCCMFQIVSVITCFIYFSVAYVKVVENYESISFNLVFKQFF